MRTAILADWILAIGGAEKVLKAIYEVYPSDVFTLFSSPESLHKLGIDSKAHNSRLQSLPWVEKYYRNLFPLFPLEVEHFDTRGYDVLISSSFSAVKGCLVAPDQTHICYCHSPARYAWDMYHDYIDHAKIHDSFRRFFMSAFLHYFRNWDQLSANRVDHFIANSQYVAQRIRKYYKRDCAVIYPPVDVDRFGFSSRKDNYFFTASRLVPYKRIDAIVAAFAKLPDHKLVVAGDGPMKKRIQEIATPNVEILGHVDDSTMVNLMQKSRAFIFAAKEDFGIIPVEAQSCGTPVIALRQGGLLETVQENTSGVFFNEATPESIHQSILDFLKDEDQFCPTKIRESVLRFSTQRFKNEFREFVESVVHK